MFQAENITLLKLHYELNLLLSIISLKRNEVKCTNTIPRYSRSQCCIGTALRNFHYYTFRLLYMTKNFHYLLNIQNTFCLLHELEVCFIRFWRGICCGCKHISAIFHQNCESHSPGKEISRILGIRNFITAFSKSRHLILSPAINIWVIPSFLIYLF